MLASVPLIVVNLFFLTALLSLRMFYRILKNTTSEKNQKKCIINLYRNCGLHSASNAFIFE